MLKEIYFDVASWWKDQSFPGKELFNLTETGELSIIANRFIKERIIATVTVENADASLKHLQEKFAVIENKIKEFETEWVATEDKTKLSDKLDHLKELIQHTVAMGEFDKAAALVEHWEQTLQEVTNENYKVKLQLAELAESLVDSEHWKEAAQTFRDIADKWKLAGHVDRGRNDKLYNRIEAARKKFQDRKRIFQEEEEKDSLNNLDLKIEIVELAESLANSGDWKATTEAFHKLVDSWKSVGRTHNKKNEELWQRLQAAKNNFFDRKKIHFNDVQQEQEQNLALKMALVEKAESMKESRDWSITSQAYTALMDEWKKIGKVPFEKSDEIWKKLNDACDYFFDAKKRHTEEIRLSHEINYHLKMSLLNRAEELKNSNYWGDVTVEMNQLLDEWKKIGPVSKEHSNTIWEAFIAARKHFFARKDANREQRKQRAEAHTIAKAEEIEARNKARVEEAKSQIRKIKEDIKEEEEKIADFKQAIENISPGKKAAELKEHLEKLIIESTSRLKHLKDKQALAGEGDQAA